MRMFGMVKDELPDLTAALHASLRRDPKPYRLRE